MKDGRRNNGGHSTKGKGGRKSKAEELGLKELMDKAVTEQDWIDIFKMAAKEAKAGSEKHAAYLSDRYFGKPSSTIDLNAKGDIEIVTPSIKFDGD